MAKSTNPSKPSKPPTRGAKPTPPATRRAEIRRAHPRQRLVNFSTLLQRQDFVYTVIIALVFVIVASVLVIWSRGQIKDYVGEIMPDARLVRVDFSVVDQQRTEQAREQAKQQSPSIFHLDEKRLDSLQRPLLNLPTIVAQQSDIAKISPELRTAFALESTEKLSALQRFAADGKATPQWRTWVNTLIEKLRTRPIVENNDAWQNAMAAKSNAPLFESPSGMLPRENAIVIGSESPKDLTEGLQTLVTEAGFPESVVPHIVARLSTDRMPTFVFDDAATKAEAVRRAAEVEPVRNSHSTGEIIHARGDELTRDDLDLLGIESEHYTASLPVTLRFLGVTGMIGLIVSIAVFLAGYISIFYPRITRNVARISSICGLMAAMLAVAVIVAVQAPSVAAFGATASTLLLAVIVLISYDQRLALFVGGLQAILVALALQTTVPFALLLFAGCGIMIVQLHEIRHRGTLIRASSITALALAIGSLIIGVIETPLVDGALIEIARNSAWHAAASFTVGFLILGVLPWIEKLFDITTGLTLVELRDPQHPLLRQLQQKAAGTYNHSLQVANIAESAANAIGADSLLVYVGALYHDIGKMNKPDYFIENQSEGKNKHEKLRPEMSLLVIVAHVKDGIEMAKEYALPKPLRHFIESHHGTTLVEYFFKAAQSKAEAEGDSAVDEIAFRYPGPKPQTREAGIMMLSDAVESATRAMSEPTPGRIGNLVSTLSRKRLEDGQFNQCDLTFRELNLIENSIYKSILSIYHNRIKYPSDEETQQDKVSRKKKKQIKTGLSA